MTQNDEEGKALTLAYIEKGGLPPVQKNKPDALRRKAKLITFIKFLHSMEADAQKQLSEIARIESGDYLNDERTRADQGKEMRKLDDAMAGRDGYAEWNRQQGEINRQKDEELQQRNRRERLVREQAQEQILRQIGHY